MRPLVRGLLVLAAALLPGLPAPAEAQMRTLDWSAFVVDARLDSTGTLHVRERQTMRMSGDWNGGERRFDTRFGQRFDLHRLLRVDPVTGEEVELRQGSLDLVDRFDRDGGTVRWRSRLPSDPPFDDTELTYILEYSYAFIVERRDDEYVLDHEFAFRDRQGTIENFALTLAVDSAWGTPPGFAGAWQEAELPIGEAFVVTAWLTWQGAGRPSAVWFGADETVRSRFAGAIAAGTLLLFVLFLWREWRASRFARLVPRHAIDRAWLEAHALSMRPEVAGTILDDRVGAPEVSATLARLVGERKLASRVDGGRRFLSRPVLHLELLVSRDALHGYERTLVDALFSGNARKTNTDEVRKRYASSGFNPAGLIESSLRAAADAVTGSDPKHLRPRRALTVAFALGALVLLLLAARERPEDLVMAGGMISAGLIPYFFALGQAAFTRRHVVRLLLHMLRFLLPLGLMLAVLLYVVTTGRGDPGPFTLGALMLAWFAFLRSVLNAAHTRATPERLALRRTLMAARSYFRHELRQPAPRLDDAWYPYFLAFGLGRHVDRWFRAFGGGTTDRDTVVSHGSGGSMSGSLSSASGGGGSWGGFGGGGGFAGAGATVAFGAAIGGMAAGVSAPSSSGSSSGGSSSSSGGSSGGGGGGGW